MEQRIAWEDLPGPLRQAIEARTGPITAVRVAAAGQNSPLAAIIDTPGDRVFAKGLPSGHRRVITQAREAAVAPLVMEISPALLWHLDEAGWNVLGYEYAPGLLLDEGATTSRVLAALPEATWAHFACHASADMTTPSQGGLALHDATLALPQVSQLRLGHAELAYLSACSTADRGVRLSDESLHLASAFHLAGFRHVIASLWPLNDRIAVTAAAAVYRYLPATSTADHAATALHRVTRDLRAEYPDRPDLWAALVHSGP